MRTSVIGLCALEKHVPAFSQFWIGSLCFTCRNVHALCLQLGFELTGGSDKDIRYCFYLWRLPPSYTLSWMSAHTQANVNDLHIYTKTLAQTVCVNEHTCTHTHTHINALYIYKDTSTYRCHCRQMWTHIKTGVHIITHTNTHTWHIARAMSRQLRSETKSLPPGISSPTHIINPVLNWDQTHTYTHTHINLHSLTLRQSDFSHTNHLRDKWAIKLTQLTSPNINLVSFHRCASPASHAPPLMHSCSPWQRICDAVKWKEEWASSGAKQKRTWTQRRRRWSEVRGECRSCKETHDCQFALWIFP